MSLLTTDPIIVDPVFFNDHWNGELCFSPEYMPGVMAKIRLLDALSIDDRKAAHAASVKQQLHAEINADGIATVIIRGMMSKSGSSMDAYGSTVAARTAIRRAAANDQVKGIRLWIESGGGMSAGTQELFRDVQAVAAIKLLYVGGEDIIGSAAYWAAAGASKIFLNEAGRAGSIGSYMMLVDSSQEAAQEGLVYHRIRFGKNKGIGAEGVAITEGDLAVVQKIIDDGGSLFVKSVSDGRKVPYETALSWATGQTYSARESLRMGLIDAIGTPEEALDALSSAVKGRVQVPVSGSLPMKMSDMKAACELGPTLSAADSAFLVRMAENDTLTETDLLKAWSKELKGRAETAQAESTKAVEKVLAESQQSTSEADLAKQLATGGNKAPQDKKSGKSSGQQTAGDAGLVEELQERIKAYCHDHPGTAPSAAFTAVCKADPAFEAECHAAQRRMAATERAQGLYGLAD